MSTDPGEHLRRVNRDLAASNALAAAGLVQQRQLIEQNHRLEQLAHQALDEERAWRMGMWLQTPDGAAYARWRESALALATELRRRDELWVHAWRAEVDAVLSPQERQMVQAGRYLPAPSAVRAQRLLPPLLLVSLGVAVLIIGFLAWISVSPVWFWGSAVLLAALAGLLAWSTLYQDSAFAAQEHHAAESLRQRRVAHFGCDPLAQPEQVPTWSPGAAHLLQLTAIEHTLATAAIEYPHPHTLPPLAVPPALEPHQARIHPHQHLLATGFSPR